MVKKPNEIHRAFQDAFNAGDVEKLVGLYERNAALVLQNGGPPIVGLDGIRKALKDFLALKGIMRIESLSIIETGDMAVSRGRWTLTGGKGSDGKPVEMKGDSIEVLRRQSDGGWLHVIDQPFGADKL